MNIFNRKHATLATLCFLAVVASGCGRDSDTAAPAEPRALTTSVAPQTVTTLQQPVDTSIETTELVATQEPVDTATSEPVGLATYEELLTANKELEAENLGLVTAAADVQTEISAFLLSNEESFAQYGLFHQLTAAERANLLGSQSNCESLDQSGAADFLKVDFETTTDHGVNQFLLLCDEQQHTYVTAETIGLHSWSFNFDEDPVGLNDSVYEMPLVGSGAAVNVTNPRIPSSVAIGAFVEGDVFCAFFAETTQTYRFISSFVRVHEEVSEYNGESTRVATPYISAFKGDTNDAYHINAYGLNAIQRPNGGWGIGNQRIQRGSCPS